MNTIKITHEQAQILIDALWDLKSNDATPSEQMETIDALIELIDKLT